MEESDLEKSVKDYFDWWNHAVPQLLPWDETRIKQWLAQQEAEARDFRDWFLHESPASAVARAIMHECGWTVADWAYKKIQGELEVTIEQTPRTYACYTDSDYDWATLRQEIQRVLARHGRRLYGEPTATGA